MTAEHIGWENQRSAVRATRRRAPMPWHQRVARAVLFALMVWAMFEAPWALILLWGVTEYGQRKGLNP